MTRSVATGLNTGPSPSPAVAVGAIEKALAQLSGPATSLILLLSRHFHGGSTAATLRAAARAAACTQIMGAHGYGVLTEEGPVIGQPACAAMVFSAPYRLAPPFTSDERQIVLSFANPRALDWDWLQKCATRFGAVTSGFDPLAGETWRGSRQAPEGRVQNVITGVRQSAFGFARGIRQLTPILPVTACQERRLIAIGSELALDLLAKSLPYSVRTQDKLPLHLILVATIFGDPATAFAAGRYKFAHIISSDPAQHALELSEHLKLGQQIFFALRDPASAKRDMRITLQRLSEEVPAPHFGLLFPSIGRGSDFFGEEDQDLCLFQEHFPDLPLIGFYGKGEIVTLETGILALQYAAAMAVFN